MIFPSRVEAGARRFPPLGEGLLAAYIVTSLTLAAAAASLVGFSLVQPGASAEILVLRGLKTAVLITVSGILLLRRRRDPVAALLSLAMLLWAITSSFDFTASPSSLPIILDRLRFLLFAWALLLFPSADWRPGWTRHVAAASFGVFLIGAAESLALLSTSLFLPLAIACVLLAIVALLMRFHLAVTRTEKQQLKWVLLGLTSGVALILSARAGAALTAGTNMPGGVPLLLEGLFQLGVIVVALGFLVSLLRYRLFDAEAAITRSAAYAGLTLALVATFAGSEALIEILGQRYLGMGAGDVSAAMAAAIAAVLLSPLHDRISAWAEQRFERDLARLKKELPDLLADLSAGSSTPAVAAAALPRIRDAIHATRAALILGQVVVGTDGVQLREVRNRATCFRQAQHSSMSEPASNDAFFPVRMAMRCPFGEVQGWLLLGPRPDGTLYGKYELAALQAVMPALRHALVATRNRGRERSLLRSLTKKVNALTLRLDARTS